jgi:transcriptional regulator with XRE-family HTH domain
MDSTVASDETHREQAEPNAAGPVSTGDPSSDRCTRKELAARLGVHPITIVKWERDGCPVETPGKPRAGGAFPTYYLESDVRVWKQKRDELAASGQTVTLTDARTQKEISQARLNEQKLLVQQRLLIPTEEVEKAWSKEFAAIRTFLLSSYTTHADQILRVASIEGLSGVERELENLAVEALRSCAAGAHVASKARRQKAQSAIA